MNHAKGHEHIARLFKERGVHITGPRLHITGIIEGAKSWLSLADIIKEASQYDRATVYRVLLLLCGHGLIHKMVDAGKTAYYRFALGEGQENTYFKCLQCGGITVLPAHESPAPLPEGFNKTASNLVITGYCGHCTGSKVNE